VEEKKIRDALDAECAVRRKLEAQYGDQIKELSCTKIWYSTAGSKEFWDVEATLRLKKGKVKQKNIRYQVDPTTGDIFGYQETPIRQKW